MDARRILCVIPARGGSKGVLRKNIRDLARKPLLAYAVESARASGVFGRIVVSTEDSEIAAVAKKYGAVVVDRPKDLAGDSVRTEPVMVHALQVSEAEGFVPTHIALIQCTSPFLSADVIREAVAMLDRGFDSCVTVFKPDGYEFKWKKMPDGQFVPEHDIENRPPRQELDLPYHENGAFYITSTALFKKTENRFGGQRARVTAVEMSEQDSLQIDSEYHFWLAEQRMRHKNSSDRT